MGIKDKTKKAENGLDKMALKRAKWRFLTKMHFLEKYYYLPFTYHSHITFRAFNRSTIPFKTA